MEKLKLNVEDLTVEQFSTETSGKQGAGTVEGYDSTHWYSGCPVRTCYC